MEPSWDQMLCMLLARHNAEKGKTTVVMPDIKRSGFPAIDMCNPRYPFRLLNQSKWLPDRRLSDLTRPARHSNARVGKGCDAWGRSMSHHLINPLV